jgi:ElaB/YqjD/DUF883 family membrane-anchored ribosome-binding protein
VPEHSTKVTLSGLASGVLAEVGNLARDTAELFREYTARTYKTGRTQLLLISGAGTVLVSAVLLCLMFVHLLAWKWPQQPVWIWYGAVGGPVFGLGIGLIAVCRHRIRSFDPLRAQSSKVMRDVTETVEHVGQAVDAARQTFRDSVDSAHEALDLSHQFVKRPWSMVAGAVSLGYLGGAVLHRDDSPGRTIRRSERIIGSDRVPGMIARVVREFGPEIVQLEGLALGALFGIVRDLLAKSASQPMERKLTEVMDGITVKLGGIPVQGDVLREPSRGNGTSRGSPSPRAP